MHCKLSFTAFHFERPQKEKEKEKKKEVQAKGNFSLSVHSDHPRFHMEM
jgi:hypothetical protein